MRIQKRLIASGIACLLILFLDMLNAETDYFRSRKTVTAMELCDCFCSEQRSDSNLPYQTPQTTNPTPSPC